MFGPMRHSLHSNERSESGSFSLRAGPRTLTMLWSCAGVGTAYVLGVDWLSQSVAGVPAGLWLVGGSLGLAELHVRRTAARLVDRCSNGLLGGHWGRPSIDTSGHWAWPRGLTGEDLRSTLGVWFGREGGVEERARASESLVARLGIGSVDGIQTVRIGVDLTEREFAALVPSGNTNEWLTPDVRVKWVRVPAGQFSSTREELQQSGRLDAIVRRQAGGSVFAFFPERQGRPSAWLDWAAEQPLSYPGVFPSRFDAAQVELAGWSPKDVVQTSLARAMIVAGAVLSRTSARMKSARLFKDRTLDDPARAGGVGDHAMRSLAAAFLDYARRPFPRPTDSVASCGLSHAAGRLLAVWASASESTLGATDREALLIAATEGLEHEPVQVLRLSAAQIAAGQDDQGIRSFLWARRRLRTAGAECESEPLAFVQSEIELGRPGGLSLGRIAAGLTLLWATCPAERSDYLRDDVRDDLRHSGWLRGREQDLALIERVMDELVRADREDQVKARSMAA